MDTLQECYDKYLTGHWTSKLPNWCFRCICPSSSVQTEHHWYASVMAGTCNGGHVVINPNSTSLYCAWCSSGTPSQCPSWYRTDCPYSSNTSGYLTTIGDWIKHPCYKCS